MALPTLDNTLDYIAQLADLPNDTDGLTAAQLKAKFDQAGQEIKEWINNTYTPEVQKAIDAAAEGVPSGQGIGTNQIADLAITTAKIAALAITAAKLADGAVTTDKIADTAVGSAKIADGAVTNRKIYAGAVQEKSISDGAVTESKIDSAAVTENKIGLYAVTTNKIKDGAVTFDKCNSTVQKAHSTATVTLPSGVSSWSNITVAGVTVNNTVVVSPAPSSFAEYNNCAVRCSEQHAGYLTFTATSAPQTALTVNVLILD